MNWLTEFLKNYWGINKVIFNNKILEEDLDDLISRNIDFESLNNNNVLITGATGLIGVSLARTLIWLNLKKKLNIGVYLMVRNEKKALSIYKNLLDLEFIHLIKTDIVNLMPIQYDIDYIFHCASVTSSKFMVDNPVETIITSLYGTNNILELSKIKKCKSIVYVSSMEMYGTFENDKLVDEDMLGYINPLLVRSNYPESKRMCENMCIAYYSQHKVPVKIARLSQTFGAGVLEGENRVFAQFAKSAINNNDIVLHTDGLSEGNYCYLSDCVAGLFTILLKGKNGEAYNVVNNLNHTTIKDMAVMVCECIANNRIQVKFDIDESNERGYANKTKLRLSGNKLMNLGWEPKFDLKNSYLRLISSMKENERGK